MDRLWSCERWVVNNICVVRYIGSVGLPTQALDDMLWGMVMASALCAFLCDIEHCGCWHAVGRSRWFAGFMMNQVGCTKN